MGLHDDPKESYKMIRQLYNDAVKSRDGHGFLVINALNKLGEGRL